MTEEHEKCTSIKWHPLASTASLAVFVPQGHTGNDAHTMPNVSRNGVGGGQRRRREGVQEKPLHGPFRLLSFFKPPFLPFTIYRVAIQTSRARR